MRAQVHALGIVFGLVAPVVVTMLSTSNSGARSAEHYAEVEHASMGTKDVILAFEKMAFDERKPKEAMERYAAPDFVDHNPNVPGNRASVIEHLAKLDWSTGGPQRTVQHLVVDGDIAMVHHRLVRKPGDPAIAAVDIFRVKNGKLVEHWDVLQPVPQESVNPRPMF